MKYLMTPDYWIEVSYHDGRVTHAPFLGTLESAYDRCARIVAMDNLKLVAFVVLLDGDYVPGQVATNNQIRGDWQGERVKGSKLYPLKTR
ncbi:MAG: hypothetical protein ACO3YZ_06925 [Candidatus Nanopelagicaceae bacterium]